MYDAQKYISCTLIDMPCKVKALALKIGDWHYILINSRLCNEEQLKAYMHELLHIDLGHLEDYNYCLRCEKETEVSEFLNKKERGEKG